MKFQCEKLNWPFNKKWTNEIVRCKNIARIAFECAQEKSEQTNPLLYKYCKKCAEKENTLVKNWELHSRLKQLVTINPIASRLKALSKIKPKCNICGTTEGLQQFVGGYRCKEHIYSPWKKETHTYCIIDNVIHRQSTNHVKKNQ